MTLKINIETVPQSQQRYATLGDYWLDDSGMHQIRISEMADERYEFLVMMHELAEYFLCQHRGILEPDIMAFDIAFEAMNADPMAEPGNHPQAPYHVEHRFAEDMIERPLAEALGVDWSEYETYCAFLCEAM